MKNIFTALVILLVFLVGNVQSQNVPKQVFKIDTSYQSVKKIEVSGQFCKVEINSSTTSSTQLIGDLSSDLKDEAYAITSVLSGAVLKIEVKYPSKGWSSHSGSVNLNIPAGCELNINTSSGRVYFKSVDVSSAEVVTKSGNIDVRKSSGDLYLESVTAKIAVDTHNGLVKTKTKTGSQFITNNDGKVSAYTYEGNIEVADIKGNTRTETSSGNTDVDRIEGPVFAKSGGGAIKISETKGDITVITFSGFVKLHNTEGMVSLKSTTGDQVGTRVYLTQSSNFNTTEGKIKMQLVNPVEDLTFELKSESSYLQAARKSKKKKLKVKGGSIMVTGISTTGGQIYN